MCPGGLDILLGVAVPEAPCQQIKRNPAEPMVDHEDRKGVE